MVYPPVSQSILVLDLTRRSWARASTSLHTALQPFSLVEPFFRGGHPGLASWLLKSATMFTDEPTAVFKQCATGWN